MRRLFMLLVVTSIIAGCKGGTVEMPSGTENLKAVDPKDAQVMGFGAAPTTPAATPTAPK